LPAKLSWKRSVKRARRWGKQEEKKQEHRRIHSKPGSLHLCQRKGVWVPQLWPTRLLLRKMPVRRLEFSWIYW